MSDDDDVAQLSFSFGDLSVSVSRATSIGGGRSWQLSVSGLGPRRTVVGSRGPPGSQVPLDRPAPAPATEPPSEADPEQDDEPEVPTSILSLGRRLGPLGGFTGEERVVRAFRLGVGDRQAWASAREGGFAYQVAADRLAAGRATPTCYVVLSCISRPAPAWTRSRDTYRQLVGTAGGGLAPESVSRAFLTRSEGRAYCMGAGLLDLPAEC